MILSNETEIAINNVQQYCGVGTKFVFVHQIYSILDNRSTVDLDLENMRKENKFRSLSCLGLTNSFANRTVLVDTTQYMEDVSKCLKVTTIATMFNDWISKNICSSVILEDVVPSIFSKDEIDIIVQCGFLRFSPCIQHLSSSHDSECVYLVSHPALGQLTISMANAEKIILSLISRSKYKEISQNKLSASIITPSDSVEPPSKRNKTISERIPFGIPVKFFILDLLGRGKIHRERNATASDFLIRSC